MDYEKESGLMRFTDEERLILKLDEEVIPVEEVGDIMYATSVAIDRVESIDISEYPAGSMKNNILAECVRNRRVCGRLLSQLTPILGERVVAMAEQITRDNS